ncbi:MAG: hydrolase [Rhizobacter sp.]|nr:hydrolase [Rhizobacter sp.]
MHLWPDTTDKLILEGYRQKFPAEGWVADKLDYLLQSQPDPFDRHAPMGHLTASAIVVFRSKLLVIHHRALGKWLPPGGHIESGETPWQAAQRETLEETGISVSLHPWHSRTKLPIDINTHIIPANPAKGEIEHVHYDLRFVFTLTDGEKPKAAAEEECDWLNVGRIELSNVRRALFKAATEQIL